MKTSIGLAFILIGFGVYSPVVFDLGGNKPGGLLIMAAGAYVMAVA